LKTNPNPAQYRYICFFLVPKRRVSGLWFIDVGIVGLIASLLYVDCRGK